MEIKFDVVRIGKIRKDQILEMILKQNLGYLKSEIHSFLKVVDPRIPQKD